MSNRRRSFLVVGILGLMLVVVSFVYQYWGPAGDTIPGQPASDQAADGSGPDAQTQAAAAVGKAGEDPESLKDRLATLASPKLRKMKTLVDSSNVPISFHGKVVDQYGQPVSGVEVSYSISELVGSIMPGSKRTLGTTTTDSQGQFALLGQGHLFVTDGLKKQGYIFEADGRSRWFSLKRHKGHAGPPQTSPEKPWIFRAWKKGEGVDLVRNKEEMEAYFPQDGQFHAIKIKGYEDMLQVAYEANPTGVSIKPLDWKIRVKATGGGLIGFDDQGFGDQRVVRDGTSLTTTAFMFVAPKEGYQEEWSQAYVPGTPGWREEDSKRFYFKAVHDGRTVYGRLEVEYKAYSSPYSDEWGKGRLVARYWINPAGSTNLTPKGMEPQSGLITTDR